MGLTQGACLYGTGSRGQDSWSTTVASQVRNTCMDSPYRQGHPSTMSKAWSARPRSVYRWD